MSPPGTRVAKPVFLGITSALFALCLLCSLVRFYIRLAVQREFGYDDGWLIVGLCCLIGGMITIYVSIDLMYEMQAVAQMAATGMTTIPTTPEEAAMLATMLRKTLEFRRLAAASTTLVWATICSVKFSFLALFKRLIRQMPRLMQFWWAVTVVNAAIAVYGVTVFFIACPNFTEKDLVQKMASCKSGAAMARQINHATAHMVLDIFGDLLILTIPVVILWQIRIPLSQKVGLGFTLCLTIIMIAVTAGRMIGLKYQGQLEHIWETLFLAASGEIGLILVSASAFRSLYISKIRVKDRGHQTITTLNWYHRSRSAFRRMAGSESDQPRTTVLVRDGSEEVKDGERIGGKIPGATMTGIRTFIDGNGKTTTIDVEKQDQESI
ncbi:unnamed protein product [Periconia digitata]|uniref:Rhodopsin domain-containing protein n=1 Tax=Periconia digitata TaxID=1303443 RepID=A0A9W4UFI4_9PLEO|nr:unnamed protein product [Periconia digitata]